MTLDVEGAQDCQLVFRSSRPLGPNALAVPSGIVVMTDSLVNLSQDDNELIAVLAHEMGHLKQRHQLRRLLQSSATGLLLVAVTGGLSSVASLGAWLPTLLVDSKYSRSLDSDADDFSLAFLTSHNIPRTALANILQRTVRNPELPVSCRTIFPAIRLHRSEFKRCETTSRCS